MRTEQLIESLSAAVTPVARHAVRARLAFSAAAGAAVTLVVIAATLGFRPDLDLAMAGGMFWMKLAYTGSVALIALAALPSLVRPEGRPPKLLWLATVPIALLGFVAAIELAQAPVTQRPALWLGFSWRECVPLIVVFALPVAIALLLVVRGLAPTRPRATGAVIGLASGAMAAMAYSLHCPEAGAAFVLTWYSLGIMTAALIGCIVGPRLLRW